MKNFCLTVPIKFVGEPFCVSKEFRYRKVSSKGGGSFTVLSKIFLSHGTKKTSPGNHSVFQKISGREKYFMDKGGGYHDFPSKFFSHCTEIFNWRTLCCFRKILLWKIFMHRREHHGFVEFFCLTGPKRKAFKRNPSIFQKFSGIEKKLWIRGISRFSVEIFMSHSAENFRQGILLFLRKFLGSKSFKDEKGGITFFRRKFLVSQCRKTFVRESYCFWENFWVLKVLRMKRGVSRFSVENFWSHSAVKLLIGTL